MSKKIILFSKINELMTLEEVVKKKGRGPFVESHLSIRKKQSLIVQNGKIVWTGPKNKVPKEFFSATERPLNANVFPGFIESHTHSLFLGDRKNEFEQRNAGRSYQDIAEDGGGIYSTVNATVNGYRARKKNRPAASFETNSKSSSKVVRINELKHKLRLRLDIFLNQGVTTVEVKTGYGLDAKKELELLEVIQQTASKVHCIPTFLGAHAIPKNRTAKKYLNELKRTLVIIAQEKLANRVDIFIDKNYFSIDQAKDYLLFAQTLGLDVCIHADQLTRTGAALLAVEIGAKSSDHNICVNSRDIRKLAKSDVTCVLLPNADLYLHCPYPPARKLIDAGVRVALSTDFNPGSSPSQSVQLVGLLARLKMKMNLPEVFAAWTVGSAYALGLENRRGALLKNYDADFFTSEASWNDFFYDLLNPQISSVWRGGEKKV